jgi:hypothetical protein
MHWLTLLWSMQQPTGSMGAPSAYRGKIFQFMTFLASPRTYLYMCLCSWLPMSVQKNAEWLWHRTEQYRPHTNDMCESIEDFEEVERLGQGFSLVDHLEEIDIGDGITTTPIFVNKNMSLEHKNAIIKLLKEYVNCFAWNYREMPGLSRELVEH